MATEETAAQSLTMSLVEQANFTTPNVSAFKHAPMAEFWDRLVTVGIKVEVVNTDCDVAQYKTIQNGSIKISNETTNNNSNNNNSPSNSQQTEKVYWIATVIKVCGYLAKLRYEGYEDDSSQDFWVYLFSDDVHGVGWCAAQNRALVPPKNIYRKLPDWTMYLIKKLTGARTLPANFGGLIKESLQTRFRRGMKLEVVDKNRVSSVRVATIEMTIGGRLLVTYDGADPAVAGFWTHERSPLVHPIGWAQFVSHELVATYEYARESLEKVNNKKFSPNDATWDMFDLPTNETPVGQRFEANMKLEAIDPLNLSSICVATVIKVLRCNYLMIGIDGSTCPTGSDWFCYHATSPCIFPAGFCKKNNIQLTPPPGSASAGEFDWYKYLQETNSRAAPETLFNTTIPDHGFREGMLIEATDLMQSRLVCIATITRVVGRLLRVHFNGWDETFDQWCDCESPDLFPWGWCELVGYPLEKIRDESDPSQVILSPTEPNKRRRSSLKKSAKKKRNRAPKMTVTDS